MSWRDIVKLAALMIGVNLVVIMWLLGLMLIAKAVLL